MSPGNDLASASVESADDISDSSTVGIELEQRAKIFAALADPTRLRMVEMLLETEELSGSEISNRLSISLALFCHHNRILTEAGLVQVRKEGQTKYNSINRSTLDICLKSLSNS